MRPLRLELEGFSAFRQRTSVSFEQVELCAFVGPTGSGKSSVIDAMTFALYGKVARYEDDRVVAPVINAQSAQARVRLDFEVAGREYTAVRVARRTKTGATTKEARLERGGEVLAGDARAVDSAVVGLLGLSFEQFTKTVVLPQGEFAAFLHETPANRQELLVRLLDLGIYGEMAKKARSLATTADTRIGTIAQQLHEMGDTDPAAESVAQARAAELTSVREELRGQLALMESTDKELAALATAQAVRTAQISALQRLAVPAEALSFEEERARTQDRLHTATTELDSARAARDVAESAVREGPGETDLKDQLRIHDRVEELEPLMVRADGLLEDARAELTGAETSLAALDEAATGAQAAVERARQRATAAEYRHELHVGDPCPVCEQVVAALPAKIPESELADALRAVGGAKKKLTDARRARDEIADTAMRAAAASSELRSEHDELTARLKDIPDRDTIRAALISAAHLRRALDDANRTVRDAETAHRNATTAAKETIDSERILRRSFTVARDSLAVLEPPAPGQLSLLTDWNELVHWGNRTHASVTADFDTDKMREAKLAELRREVRREVTTACCEHGVDGERPQLLEHLAMLVTRAETEAERIRERREQAQRLRGQVEGLRAEQQVADELGRLLGSSGFQQWLLEEALGELVAGATDRLFSLSSGQFSLERDDKGFLVRDHHNADELRPVKTLSGGETFLASLALALALADNVAALSTQDSPKLGSIFLDEGFGTLDPDTLDTVAAAIEELGASGRLVGVVTHIRDLADRLPVRFEVSKLANTSTVDRVER